jgi:hypothetical protein
MGKEALSYVAFLSICVCAYLLQSRSLLLLSERVKMLRSLCEEAAKIVSSGEEDLSSFSSSPPMRKNGIRLLVFSQSGEGKTLLHGDEDAFLPLSEVASKEGIPLLSPVFRHVPDLPSHSVALCLSRSRGTNVLLYFFN